MTNDKLRKMAEDFVKCFKARRKEWDDNEDKEMEIVEMTPEALKKTFAQALSTYGQSEFERGRVEEQKVLEDLFNDHYWDTLEKDKDLITAHILAVFRNRAQAELEAIKSSSKPE
jgi:hypothetical protein